MNRQRFDESADASQSPQQSDRSLTCRVAGCPYRWAVDMSHGKVCSMHDDFFGRNPKEQVPGKRLNAPMAAIGEWWKSPQHQQATTRPMALRAPRHEPTRHYAEQPEPEEDYVHDDRA